jgi:transposase
MEFREIDDGEWELIKPLLPPRAKTGRPRVDDRVVLNGIIYVLLGGLSVGRGRACGLVYLWHWHRGDTLWVCSASIGFQWIVRLLRLRKGGAFRLRWIQA